MRAITFAVALTGALAAASAGSAQTTGPDRGPLVGPLAERPLGPTYGLYGTPGLIEMPTAQSAPDAEVGTSFSYAGGTLRNSLTFQIGERLSGTFRYARIENFNGPGDALFDRNFDLRFRLVDEGPFLPAVSIGLQDFIGTGVSAGEYVVATKTLGRVTATVGLGWGRLGSYEPIGATGTRPGRNPNDPNDQGGQFLVDQLFRGDYAAFGGLAWQVNDTLTLKAEYSSDANTREVAAGNFERDTPLNFGVDYRIRPGMQLSAYSLYGTEIGVMASFTFNPKFRTYGQTFESAPAPVLVRPRVGQPSTAWATSQRLPFEEVAAQNLGELMAADGFVLEGLDLQAREVTIRYRNTRHFSQAQGAGRLARLASRTLPPSVERFVLVPVKRGLPGAAIVILRSSLERFEYAPGGADQVLAASVIEDAAGISQRAGTTPARGAPAAPRTFTYGIRPYARLILFDPVNPLRLDGGVALSAEWNPTRGLYFSGELRQRLIGNADQSDRFSDSVLPQVRSASNFYDQEGDTLLQHLTVAYHFRPGRDLYGRVTAGYLERMFAGVSTELLWKPVSSRLAFGVELNYVKQRSFDGGFGFEPLQINGDPNTNGRTGTVGGPRDYEVFTGHVSAYYDLSQGYHAQLDVGQYLAGDVGATLTIDREFKNGWKVGAYATLTDVAPEDFGEGSFDKGIRLTIPLNWAQGTASRRANDLVIQPVLRDGGARLEVRDRLYPLVRDTHRPELEDGWDRFWR
ncbi:MAG: YjbH domain-containing protein [Pseudomonadota bacterium]